MHTAAGVAGITLLAAAVLTLTVLRTRQGVSPQPPKEES